MNNLECVYDFLKLVNIANIVNYMLAIEYGLTFNKLYN